MNRKPIRTGNWSRTPRAAYRDKLLGKSALRVLGELGGYADPDGESYPFIATIARDLDLHRRSVERALAKLEARGYVTRVHRMRKGGGFASNTYRINYDAAPVAASSQFTDAAPVAATPAAPVAAPILTAHGNNPSEYRAGRVSVPQSNAPLAANDDYRDKDHGQRCREARRALAVWHNRTVEWAVNGTWLRAWGPQPDEPGCRAPKDIASKATAFRAEVNARQEDGITTSPDDSRKEELAYGIDAVRPANRR